ncbi:MAG: ATP-binding protein [Rhodospirillales bacterium]
MDLISAYLARGYVPLIANIGLLALLAWVVSLFGRYLFVESENRGLPIGVGVGVLFGAAAAALMGLPIEMEPGIFGDARGAPVLLSGIVGGPVAGAITGTMAAATRLYLGGPGAVGGAMFVVVFAVVGIGWGLLASRQGRSGVRIVELACLAGVAVAMTAPIVLLFPADKQYQVLLTLWPQLFVANVAGVTILGTFINREYRRRQAEREIASERARAEREAEARTRFLNSMSHEMRTPLNGLLGILQLVQYKDLPRDVRRDLGIAMDSGHYLLTLINQVLDLAKLDSGQVIVSKQPFTPGALLDNLYSIFKYQADGKGLYLRTHIIGDGDGTVSGDFEHIRQILFNLLGNAVKFTRKGGIDLVARVRQHDGGMRLRIEVSDTGPGIAPDDLERIFEDFQQTSTGRNLAGSSGLGLSICRQLANALDAKITVESELGSGSTFALEIDVEETDVTELPDDRVQSAEPLNRPLSVLVAEDNSLNQMVVRGMLEDDGHSVTMADNGKTALELVTRNPGAFDLILMDVQMPEMDGIEATRAIRALASVEADFPIVGLTANAFTDQHGDMLKAGMDGVLTKPLSIEALRRKLAEVAGAAIPAPDTGQAIPEQPVPERDAAAPEDAKDAETSSLDYNAFRTLYRHFGDRRLNEMLTEFEVKSLTLVSRLRESGNGHSDTSSLAHELKGMAANFGFAGAAALLAEIERNELADDTYVARLDRVDDELEQSIVRAQEWIRSEAKAQQEESR